MTRPLLGVALLATLVAAWFAPPRGDEGVPLSEHARHLSSNPPQPPLSVAPMAHPSSPVVALGEAAAPMSGLRPRDQDKFEDLTLLVPAPTPMPAPVPVTPAMTPQAALAALPAVAPQAPPLPFRYLGRYDDMAMGQAGVFLQYNDQSLVVHLGDTVLSQYKLESLDGPFLILRYLPLDQTQTLATGPN